MAPNAAYVFPVTSAQNKWVVSWVSGGEKS